MNLSRILPVVIFCAAPVCHAQLPPSILQPGRPVASVPVAQPPAAPASVPEPAPAAAVPGAPNGLTAEEAALGWRSLFDGRRVYGMRGIQKVDPIAAGWRITNGELNLPKEVKDMDRVTGGDIITIDQYWDFEFSFEWKSTAAADSGVRYMLTEQTGQTPVGLEYQIIDDVHAATGLKGGPLRRTGALDGILPVGPNAKLRTADPLNNITDPWNEGRIVVQGNHVEHWLNGDKVLEFELGPKLRQLAEANKLRVPTHFGTKVRTRVAILDQGTEVAFRNLKIRPLIPTAVITPMPGGPRPVAPGGNTPNPLLLPRGR